MHSMDTSIISNKHKLEIMLMQQMFLCVNCTYIHYRNMFIYTCMVYMYIHITCVYAYVPLKYNDICRNVGTILYYTYILYNRFSLCFISKEKLSVSTQVLYTAVPSVMTFRW